jgi:hypothetical protein
MISLNTAQLMLDSVPRRGLPFGLNIRDYQAALHSYITDLIMEADILTLRGMVALERGDTTKAAGLFTKALSVWGNDAAFREGKGLDFPGRPVAQYYSQRIEAAKTTKQPETKRQDPQ